MVSLGLIVLHRECFVIYLKYSYSVDVSIPELWDSYSWAHSARYYWTIGFIDVLCTKDTVMDWNRDQHLVKCYVLSILSWTCKQMQSEWWMNWTLWALQETLNTVHTLTILPLLSLKIKKEEEEENPPYLLPSALCYHVTAGNSKEEHHKPNLKERGRQTESTKGGSESTLGASEEAIFSHKDQSITKKPSEVERESPLNRFSSFQLSWTHQHNTIVY